MKKKLLTITLMFVGVFSFAQFTTGTVLIADSNRTIKMDTDATTVTMTLTGSSTTWIGVGFGGTSMGTVLDMFIWNATENRDYTTLGNRSLPLPDAAESQSWTIVSDEVDGATRTIVATRALVSSGDYTFLNDNSAIPIIFAEGSSTTLGYHGGNIHAGQILSRDSLGLENFSLQASAIFPNPSNGSFTISTQTALNKINIYSQIGALIKTIKVKGSSENAQVYVDGLQSGMYLIELENKSEKSWKKVIVN